MYEIKREKASGKEKKKKNVELWEKVRHLW